MTIEIDYETDKELNVPYEEIIKTMVAAVLHEEECPYEAEVNIVLTDNDEIRIVNREYRNIDAYTDVLSFPMIEYEEPADFSQIEQKNDDYSNQQYFNPESGELLLGDIMVSVDQVIEQANQFGHSQIRELAFLITHSMLHLLGYDHIEEDERMIMEQKQADLLTTAGFIR